MEPEAGRHEGFFARPNLHAAGWVILFGIGGYFLGFIDPFDKPQEVVVKNIDSFQSRPGSTVVTLDGRVQADMALLRDALKATQDALVDAKSTRDSVMDEPAIAASAESEVVQQLRDAQRALQDAMKLASPSSESGAASTEPPAMVSLLVPDSIDGPQFPPEIRGYTLEAPKGVRGIRCPTYHASSRRLRFSFDVDATLLKHATPFRLSVASIQAPLKQTHVFEDYFPARTGLNDVELDFNVPAGAYDVTLGYYDRRKLESEFPPFYAVSCTVQV